MKKGWLWSHRFKYGPPSAAPVGVHVVAGGAGFVGAHLCRRLLGLGHTVVAVDDLSTGDRNLVDDLATDPSFSLVVADICHWTGPDDIEAVWHLASPAAPRAYLAAQRHTLLTGSTGTDRLAEMAHRNGAPLLFTSTSEVYGASPPPQREGDLAPIAPAAPRSVYIEAKRHAEALLMAWHREAGLDVRIARLFNVYGPGWAPGDTRVVPAFITALREGRPLPIAGDGSQTRSFCFIDDMVDGLLARMAWASPDPVNLGRDEEVSIAALADALSETHGRDLPCRRVPRLDADCPRRRPHVGLARARLGWHATTPLDEGLARTLAATARLERP